MTTTAHTGAAEDGYDPFEAFNEANGSLEADPYPELAERRAQGDIVQLDLGVIGVDPAEQPPMLEAVSYEAVQEVLRDGERFSSSGYADATGLIMGRTILEMDEPEHRTYRSLISAAFTRKAMEEWELDPVRPVIDRLIDDFEADGRAELVRQLFFPFPVEVIAGMLGLPQESRQEFQRLAVEIISFTINFDRAQKAGARLAELLTPLIHERRQSPGRDLVSVLATAEHEGQQLTDDEIISFCRLLLPAGAETTYRSSANLMCGLLSDRDLFGEIRADRSLVPTAIEEGLRWEPPLMSIMRTATHDTTVCGVPVAAGARIMTNIGSANHDERRWPHPERLDLHRDTKAHIAFAAGPHMCLGMHLARMETRVVLERILDRLPHVRLDPEAEPPRVLGRIFRAPYRLDVLL